MKIISQCRSACHQSEIYSSKLLHRFRCHLSQISGYTLETVVYALLELHRNQSVIMYVYRAIDISLQMLFIGFMSVLGLTSKRLVQER